MPKDTTSYTTDTFYVIVVLVNMKNVTKGTAKGDGFVLVIFKTDWIFCCAVMADGLCIYCFRNTIFTLPEIDSIALPCFRPGFARSLPGFVDGADIVIRTVRIDVIGGGV
jgi:hypothetical protein